MDHPQFYEADIQTGIRRGLLWVGSTTAIWQVISWVLTIITARLLSPNDYGLLAIIESVSPYLLMLCALKLDTWLIQRESLSEREESVALFLVVTMGAALAALAFAFAPALALYYREERITPIARLLSAIFVLRSFQLVPDARLRRAMRFKEISLALLCINLARGMLQVSLAYFGFAYWSLVAGMLFAETVTTITYVALAGLPRRARWDCTVAGEAIRFGAAATAATLFWVVYSTADNLIVGRLFGTTVLGFYAMAFYLADLPLSKVNTVLSPLILSYYSRLKSDGPALRSAYLKISRTTLLIVAPTLLGFAVVAPLAVPLIFGSHWTALTVPLQILCGAGILRALTVGVAPLFYALNRPRECLYWSASLAVVMPLCFFFLGRLFGMNGIYTTWLLVYPFCGILPLLLLLKKVSGVTLGSYFGAVVPPLCAALPMVITCGASFLAFRQSFGVVSLLFLEVGVGFVTYAVMLLTAYRGVYHDTVKMLLGLRGAHK